MTLSVAFLDDYDTRRDADTHAAKRRKTNEAGHSSVWSSMSAFDDSLEGSGASRVPKHPYGVKPLGNLYDASSPNIRLHAGTLAILPDELIITISELLDSHELNSLGSTCKALYAFSRAEELWKALFIEYVISSNLNAKELRSRTRSPPADFQWRGNWRSTYLCKPKPTAIACHGLYSDVLYRPFQCAHITLNAYASNIPIANEIPRIPDLSRHDFNTNWADKPFILTKPVTTWPIYKQWDTDHLISQYADTAFRAEAVDWPLRTYMDYMTNSADESPLYLFDCYFAEKMKLTLPPTLTLSPTTLKITDETGDHANHDTEAAGSDADGQSYDYTPPSAFSPDLFHALGSQRPHHRWLIVGPTRSGSTFHKDPNATSAWNAVLRGSKYWIMFPSTSSSGKAMPPPPGVFVSADQSEVTSPLSIAEWLLGFHAEARATPGCMEGICGEGEVLYVPSGWFHLVLNLQDSVAVTQNFVPRAHLGSVLHFLKQKPEQVTGFGKDVGLGQAFELFVEKLRAVDVELLEQGLQEMEVLGSSQKEKSRWEELTETKEVDAGGFSFGFGGDEEDEYE